jgi:hypothetical protein
MLVAQSVLLQIIGLILNNKFEILVKEEVVAIFKVLPENWLRGTEENN